MSGSWSGYRPGTSSEPCQTGSPAAECTAWAWLCRRRHSSPSCLVWRPDRSSSSILWLPNQRNKTESDDLDSLNGTSKDQTRISGKVTGLICGNIQEDELLSFDCVHCDYKAKKKDYLMSHIKTVHEKVKYNCDKCDKQFTQKCHLKSHFLVVHEGIRYPCKLCDFVTKFKPALKHHIQALHDGIKFHCQHCEYKSGYKSKLREHMNQEHPILMESMDNKI